MEDDLSYGWLGAGSAKGEEHSEEDGVGHWSSSRAQSHQESVCEVREEQAYALSSTCRCSCFVFLVDWMSPVLFGLLGTREWKFEVFEQKVWNFHGIARSSDSAAKHPLHYLEVEMLCAEVVWLVEDQDHHRP